MTQFLTLVTLGMSQKLWQRSDQSLVFQIYFATPSRDIRVDVRSLLL